MACTPHKSPEETREMLTDWEPCMVEFTEPMFGKRVVPGYRCKHCGALYGTAYYPPEKCWKCPPKQEMSLKPTFCTYKKDVPNCDEIDCNDCKHANSSQNIKEASKIE
jgi:hypothetical protein